MDANVKQVKDFFATGDPSRDSMKAWGEEWKQLSDADKAEVRALVGAELGL